MQLDLADMGTYYGVSTRRSTRRYRYILIFIDCLSRKLFTAALHSKG